MLETLHPIFAGYRAHIIDHANCRVCLGHLDNKMEIVAGCFCILLDHESLAYRPHVMKKLQVSVYVSISMAALGARTGPANSPKDPAGVFGCLDRQELLVAGASVYNSA